MRSHVTVYRAPDNATNINNINNNNSNACHHQFARYALHAPPLPPTTATWNTAAPTAYSLHGIMPPNAAAAPTPPQLVVNQQRINECAGIPLISNACNHLTPAQRQRMLRKSSSKAWPATATHAMSQLAAHAQGQPLLQNSKQQQQQQQQHLHHHHHQLHQQQQLPQQQQHQQHLQQPWPAHANSYHPMRLNNFQLTDKSRVLRYQNSAPAVLSSQEKQQQQQSALSNTHSSNHNNNNNNSNNSNSCSSTNAGQDATPATMTESCLPRIIKPRKRRKKDRKPANGVLLKLDAELQPKLTPQAAATLPAAVYAAQQAQMLPNCGNNNLQQHDHSHGVCFCRDCDPLRSLWDYPLRRSHSDASSQGQSSNSSSRGSCSTSSSTTSSSSDNSCASSICSQQQQQQLHQHQHKQHVANSFDETTTTEHFAPITGDSSRAEIVGVIGSQRSHAHVATTTTTTNTAATATALYLSDSNDSGYGDILSGMNIANDLFASCFNHVATATSGGGGGAGRGGNAMDANAETLLNESINEISRKLIETCAVNEPTNAGLGDSSIGSGSGSGRGSIASGSGSGSGDSDSCSASASDSGLDSAGSYNSEALVFNFEHLHLTDTNFVTPTAMDFLVDCNNNCNSNSGSSKQQFYNNCFDLVWRSSSNSGNSNNHHSGNQVTAGKSSNSDSGATTPTTLILGTVGKLKPAFSTIS